VRSNLKGTGLGSVLMHKLIRTLREHGTRRLVATVLQENQRMLALAQALGFERQLPPAARGMDAPDKTVEIALLLQPAATGASFDTDAVPP